MSAENLKLKRAFRAGDRARLARLRQATAFELAYTEAEPLVSVIVSTFNRPELLLERALPSMLAQDYPRWELLVIGDGMKPEHASVLERIREPRVFVHNLKARGRYPHGYVRWNVAGTKPANFGLRVARGRWVAHLDDDDEYTPSHISVLLSLARSKHVEWVHGEVLLMPKDDEGDVRIGAPVPILGRIAQASALFHGALKTFRFNGQCWGYGYPGDWDLWERFLEAGVTHAHLPQVVGYHYNERPAMRRRLRELNAPGYA